jgi:hypothetical protein
MTILPWNAIQHWQQIQELIRSEVATYALRIGTVTAVEGKQVRVQLQGDSSGGPYGLYSVATPFTPSVGDIVVLDRLQGGGLVVIGSTLLTASNPTSLPANAPMVAPSYRFSSQAGIYSGTSSPEGSVTAAVGSVYLRTSGAAGGMLYTKVSGSGNTGWALIASGPRIIGPPGAALNTSVNSPFVSGSTQALYMGRADAAWAYEAIRFEVTVAASGFTWCEVGIATSPEFEVGDTTVNLTRQGWVDVSFSVNSTGEKTIILDSTGNISPGEHVWLLFGSSSTTPWQIHGAYGGGLSAGNFRFSSATRISTMPASESFSISSNTNGWFAVMTAI